MHTDTFLQHRVAPSAAPPVVSALHALESDVDGHLVSMPSPHVQIVVRFGPLAPDGIDVHVLGPRESVHRKRVRGGQWALLAHLELGAAEAVLGLPASRIGSGHAPLEDFWGAPRTARLLEALAAAQAKGEAAALLDRAIHEHLATNTRDANQSLVLAAANRLERASVRAVAAELGVSERHLRRVFREVVGLSPKTFASLARFRRAIRSARDDAAASWARVAATAGYYDQAHLISEFRAIAGVTPRSLLREVDNG